MSARSWYHRTAGLLVVATAAVALSCGKDDPVGPPPPVPPPTVERVVLDAGGFPSVTPDSTGFAMVRFDSTDVDAGRLLCTDYEGDQVASVPVLTILAADVALHYPGSILQFGTLEQLAPAPVVADRAAGTLTLTVAGGAESSGEVAVLDGGPVETWRRSALAELGDHDAGPWNLSVDAVASDEHLALHAGVAGAGMTAAAVARLAVSDDTRGRALVRLRRVDHSVACAWPGRAGLAFADDVDGNDIVDQVAVGNPPVWLGRVDHGELVLVLVEAAGRGDAVAEAATRTFQAAATGAAPDAGDLIYDLADLDLQVFSVGADADAIAAAAGAGLSELTAALQAGPSAVADLPAVTAAVEALADGDPVSLNLAAGYGFTHCDAHEPVFEDVLWSYAAADAHTERRPGDLRYEGEGRYYYSGGSGQFVEDEVVFVPDLLGGGGSAESQGRRPLLITDETIGKPVLTFFELVMPAGILHSELTFDGTSMVGRDYTVFLVLGRPRSVKLTYDTALDPVVVSQVNNVNYFLHGVGDGQRNNLRIGFLNEDEMKYSHEPYHLQFPYAQPIGWRIYAFRFGVTTGMTAWVDGEMLDHDPSDTYSLLQFNGATLCTRWLGEEGYDLSTLLFAEAVAYAGAGSDQQVVDEVARLREKYGL